MVDSTAIYWERLRRIIEPSRIKVVRLTSVKPEVPEGVVVVVVVVVVIVVVVVVIVSKLVE